MLSRLARVVVRRRRRVLLGSVVFLLVAGAVGGNVADKLSSGGFEDPNAESTKAEHALERTFNQGPPNLLLLVTAKGGNVDAPDVAAEGARLTRELLREPGVSASVSYWTLGSPPPLRSKAGNQALVIGRIAGNQNTVHDRIRKIAPRYMRDDALVSVRVGGFAEVFRQVNSTIRDDLSRAEAIALPITLLLLVLVFGSAVAASLPLAIGIVAIIGTFLALRAIAAVTEVSIFALNLTTAMGLALAVDYSLFVVSRFREELRAGGSVEDAVVRTTETAGRTVLFSALTVAVSLAALFIFPLSFLRSFAYAGIPVVALAATGAVVALPALLAALGPRVDKWAIFHTRPKQVGEGFWHRVAVVVMRRPIPIGTAIIVVLLFLGGPFLHVRFNLPDDRVLPPSASSHQVQEEIRHNFSSNEAGAVEVVAVGVGSVGARLDAIAAYAARLSTIRDVARVDALTGSYIGGRLVVTGPTNARFGGRDSTWFSVVPSVEAESRAGERVVKDVRHTPAPFPVRSGGPSAQLVDAKSSLFTLVPLAAVIIGMVTFTVLFLMTGSVVVPVKAVVLNLLSLTATFGAMVWIFQEGHLAGFLDFTPTGALDTSTPILMFCIAFGLSMDYEVFLLSRIKEEHDRTGDNVSSVALGLERTGRIVTAAAALLAVVFLAFATSHISFIKLFGIGLTMAVVMDATLIRAVLVPAFMRLAGNANWWAPRPLRRLYDRYGLREAPEPERPRQPLGV